MLGSEKVDTAGKMTGFTRSQTLNRSAAAMLSQVNTLPAMGFGLSMPFNIGASVSAMPSALERVRS